jgi:hypothetical protein
MLHAVFEHIGWKLLSLAIAIFLWVIFVGSPALITSVSAPIQYQDMPRGLEISSDVPEGVYLEIQGPSARLGTYELSGTAVVLDLRNVRLPGEYTFTIDSDSVRVPTGLHLVRAVPAQLRLTFERQMQNEVPVRVRFAGPPPAGYQVGALVQPPLVRIIGPESRVRDIGFAETDPIDPNQVRNQTKLRVHTFIRDPHVRLLSSPVVTVEIHVEKTASEGQVQDGETTVRD